MDFFIYIVNMLKRKKHKKKKQKIISIDNSKNLKRTITEYINDGYILEFLYSPSISHSTIKTGGESYYISPKIEENTTYAVFYKYE